MEDDKTMRLILRTLTTFEVFWIVKLSMYIHTYIPVNRHMRKFKKNKSGFDNDNDNDIPPFIIQDIKVMHA
jgi:hypothetical protein